MSPILSLVQVFISVVLIFLVLMPSGKDAGLSGAFGVGTGAGPLGGGSLVERNLNRWTVGFAIAFVVTPFVPRKTRWAPPTPAGCRAAASVPSSSARTCGRSRSPSVTQSRHTP